MAKGITKFFPAPFLVMFILLFSTVSIVPTGATERDNKEHHTKRNTKSHYNHPKNKRLKYQPQQNDRLKINNQLQAKNQLKKLIYDLGEKKDGLQKTYMYWTLSTAHAGYSLVYNSEDVLYRCLHVSLNIAPYITPHLPSRAQLYFQGGISGAGILLEGMRALVHTKRWAWEQILGYTSLYFMKALPEGTLGEELQGGLYFFFKAAGFYHVNFSLPYLPDSLWEQMTCYRTSCNAVADNELPGGADETSSNTRFIMTKAKKREMYNELDVAFHEAEYCEPDTQKQLEQLGLLKSFQEKIDSCNTIVDSWKKLRPHNLESHSFSVEPSSEVLVVNQRQYAVANGHDFKHVFVTGDLMKCVGLGLYIPETSRCGLAHADGENIRSLDAYLEGKLTYKDNIDDFHRFILDVAGNTPLSKIHAVLVSGYWPHINYFMKYMEIFGIKNIEVIHDPQWTKMGNSYYNDQLPKGSIAINCQNGVVSNVINEPEIRKQMGPPPNDKGALRPLTKVNRGK